MIEKTLTGQTLRLPAKLLQDWAETFGLTPVPYVAIEPKIVTRTCYGIYDHPLDAPGHFVVRQHYVTLARETLPDAFRTTFDSLGSARASLPRGLSMVHRSKQDDATLIETWI